MGDQNTTKGSHVDDHPGEDTPKYLAAAAPTADNQQETRLRN